MYQRQKLPWAVVIAAKNAITQHPPGMGSDPDAIVVVDYVEEDTADSV